MASSLAIKKLVQHSAVLKRGAEAARQEIFGNLPQLNIQSGHQKAKQSFTGPYLAKYYPESINTFARKVGGVSVSCFFRCLDPTDFLVVSLETLCRSMMAGKQSKRNTVA
jgi:hypothetical protein